MLLFYCSWSSLHTGYTANKDFRQYYVQLCLSAWVTLCLHMCLCVYLCVRICTHVYPEIHLRSRKKVKFKYPFWNMQKLLKSPLSRGIKILEQIPQAIKRSLTKVKFKRALKLVGIYDTLTTLVKCILFALLQYSTFHLTSSHLIIQRYYYLLKLKKHHN